MINANEARIVTNENEYKEILRAEEQAQREAKEAAERELRRIKAEQNLSKEVFDPIGEAIAQRAAEGYSNISIKVYNSTYTSSSSIAYNVDAYFCNLYTATPLYVNEYVPTLEKAITNYLKSFGYRVTVTRDAYYEYRAVGYIQVAW